MVVKSWRKTKLSHAIIYAATLAGLCAATSHATARGTSPSRAPITHPTVVDIETALGSIEAVIFVERAPVTANNFLSYVRSHAYSGGRFFRSVRKDNQPQDAIKISVIQGDVRQGTHRFPPIPIERTSQTGIHHWNGTLSMARARAGDATTSFFICIGDQPELDFGGRRNRDGEGFAAFGRVVRGMDVVRRINSSRVIGQRLTPTVTIRDILVVK